MARQSNPTVNDALESATKIRTVIDQAKSVFIDRDDALDALGTCLCAGEHLLMLGKPGLAKSAIVHWVSQALACQYFWIVLNPDTLREDLVGPISMTALNQDKWDRKWSGLALADIAMVDEVGKASNQVVNMLLNAFEERRFPTPDGDKQLPLHIAIGASNETLDGDAAAMWDRFTVRTIVQPIDRLESFRKMLTTNVDSPPNSPITRDELSGLRSASTQMALNTPNNVLDMVTEMKDEFSVAFENIYVSDRRWRRLLKTAAGHALYHNRTQVSQEDLSVGKWMLWENVDPQLAEIKAIQEWVRGYAERGLQELLESEALSQDLLKQCERVRDVEHGTEIVFNARKLALQAKKMLKTSNTERWQHIIDTSNLVEETVLGD